MADKENNQINTFELSREWFDWCYENPELISTNHTALYFFIIDHYNRLGWKQKFGLPTMMAMEAIGIKSWKTYSKAFSDIVSWGFIKVIEKSKNQYSATVIALVKNTKANTKALTKATQKHLQKQSSSTVVIDKPINQEPNNLEQDNKNEFEKFRLLFAGTKRGLDTEFENFKKKHKDYKEVIPILCKTIENFNIARKQKQATNQWVPEYPNLSTWINQRRWEEEIQETQPPVKPLSKPLDYT